MNVVLQKTAIATIDGYLESGGGAGIRTARRFGPEATIEELTAAGLRGRGGVRIPDRSQMGLHPTLGWWPPLRGGQWR